MRLIRAFGSVYAAAPEYQDSKVDFDLICRTIIPRISTIIRVCQQPVFGVLIRPPRQQLELRVAEEYTEKTEGIIDVGRDG